MKNKFNKIIIVAHENFGSREIFSKIIENFPDKEYVLYMTQGLYYKRSIISSFLKLLKEASFIFCFQKFLDLLIYHVAGDTLQSRAKKKGINIRYVKDINSQQVLEEFNSFKPDIMLSLYTMHIYRNPILGIPKICLGTHPSLLPNYRGLEVYFWALANGEKSLGISIFYINRIVDLGDVIAFTTFPIEDKQSVDGLYAQLSYISADLYVKALKDIFEKGEKLEAVNTGQKDSKYYPMPTSEAQRKFALTGRKYRDKGIVASFLLALRKRFQRINFRNN